MSIHSKVGVGTVRFGSKLSRTDLNRLFYKKNRIRIELNKNGTQTDLFGSVRLGFFGSGPILNFQIFSPLGLINVIIFFNNLFIIISLQILTINIKYSKHILLLISY
ncbi:hypothetical protein WN943_027343 [Citrus x changshan-huyou]